MGFAETGSTSLKNNRRKKGTKPHMNDAHLKATGSHEHKKISQEELEEYKEKLANERKRESKRTLIVLVSLVVFASIVVGILFFAFLK